jgi:hypothetical protein
LESGCRPDEAWHPGSQYKMDRLAAAILAAHAIRDRVVARLRLELQVVFCTPFSQGHFHGRLLERVRMQRNSNAFLWRKAATNACSRFCYEPGYFGPAARIEPSVTSSCGIIEA